MDEDALAEAVRMEAEQTTLRVAVRWPAGRRVRRALALFGLACLAWTAAALPLVWVDAVLWLLVTGTGWAAAILVAKRLADGQERRSMARSGPSVRLTSTHLEVPLGASVRRFDRRHLQVEAWATQPQNHRGVYTHQAWVRLEAGAEAGAGGDAEGAVVLVGAREQGVIAGLGYVSLDGSATRAGQASVVEVALDGLLRLYGALSRPVVPVAGRSRRAPTGPAGAAVDAALASLAALVSAREARPRSDGGEAAMQALLAARRRLIGVLRAQQASAQARVAELRKRLVDEVYARRALPPATPASPAPRPGPALAPSAEQGASGVVSAGGASAGGVSAGGVSSGMPETWTDEALWEWVRTGRAAALPAAVGPRLGLLRDAWGRTPLHEATGVAQVRALLALGLAADARDARGCTPLMAHGRSRAENEALLAAGADAAATDHRGWSTLRHQALPPSGAIGYCAPDYDALQVLLAAGAPLPGRAERDEWQAAVRGAVTSALEHGQALQWVAWLERLPVA